MCQVGPADDGAPDGRLFDIRIERRVAPLEGLGRVCTEPAGIDEELPSADRAGQTEIERIIGSGPCFRTGGEREIVAGYAPLSSPDAGGTRVGNVTG
jgi:hypothetical protein